MALNPHRGAGEPAHVANRVMFKLWRCCPGGSLLLFSCCSFPPTIRALQSLRGWFWNVSNDSACRRCGDMMLFPWLKSGTPLSGLLEARKRAHWSLATLATSSRQDSQENAALALLPVFVRSVGDHVETECAADVCFIPTWRRSEASLSARRRD